MYANKYATLTEYKSAFNKAAIDYVIRFQSRETSIETIIEHTCDIIKQLVDGYHTKNKTIKARLVAKVMYINTKTESLVSYYHPSKQFEIVNNVEDFFYTHMLKIAERMDNFNCNGSNLLIHNIEEIHIHIDVLNSKSI